MPGTVGPRGSVGASGGLAVVRLARARAVRRASSSVLRPRATAMVCCTAAAAKRAATPARVALDARVVPSAGR
jgi:hypothetical protein